MWTEFAGLLQLSGPVILGAKSFNQYVIVLDLKEQCLCYDRGGEVRKRQIDRLQEANFEATNSAVAKNCAVRHTDHTHVATPLEDTPTASCCITEYLQTSVVLCGKYQIVIMA
jgi:hypothetical protein